MGLFTKKEVGIMPDAKWPMVTAEPTISRKERQKIIARVMDLTGGKPGLLAEWIVRREVAYFNGPAKRWNIGGERDDIVAYVSCVDCLRFYEQRKRTVMPPVAKRTWSLGGALPDKAEA